MPGFSRILAATDLSHPARHAVERAFYLATGAASELCILHAIELDALDSLRELLGGDVWAVKAALRRDAEARLARMVGDTAIRHEGVLHTAVVDGNPLVAIANEAEARAAELIVLGARGESFLRHALLGSTAARLLRKSSRQPVLIVKQAPHQGYRSVLVAVDFSPVSRQAIRLARQAAPGAELILFHAFELPYEGKLVFAGVGESLIRQYVSGSGETRRKNLHDLAAAAGLATKDYAVRVVHGDPKQQVIAVAREIDADLIVVGKHGVHVAEALLIGSVAKHVLAESPCDLLVICDRGEAAAIS